jgi:hypothetical protein
MLTTLRAPFSYCFFCSFLLFVDSSWNLKTHSLSSTTQQKVTTSILCDQITRVDNVKCLDLQLSEYIICLTLVEKHVVAQEHDCIPHPCNNALQDGQIVNWISQLHCLLWKEKNILLNKVLQPPPFLHTHWPYF